MYTAILMLGGNEIGPRTYLELVTCTAILIVLAIFNASLFGELAILSEVAQRKQNKFQDQIDVANTVMKQLEIPIAL